MKTLLSAVFSLLVMSVCAQDISYNRSIVDTLTTPYFWGRGYTKDGMKKAADFLAAEFKNIGLKPLGKKKYLQKFFYAANTFPSDMEVMVNDKKLIPGVDFLVTADSHSSKAKGKLEQKDSITFVNASEKIIVTLANKLT